MQTDPTKSNYDDLPMEQMGDHPPLDPFEDDTPIACGIENPDTCESCT